MKSIVFFIICLWILSAEVFPQSNLHRGSIEYLVSMPNPHTHYFEVEVRLNNYGRDYVDFKMPVWTPGSYLVREYEKNVEGFHAAGFHDQKSLKFHKVNKNTWRVEKEKEQSIAIKYRVYAFEGFIRMSYLDEDHALIMANTIFMYVDELKDNSTVLRLSYPDTWKSISTSLSELNEEKNAYHVPNYDILVDSPIEIGNHEKIQFEAADVPHEVAMVGKVEFDEDKLVRDLSKIIESATSIFGENPNESYTFIIQTDKRGGGLEHMNSTILGVDRWTFSNQRSYNYFLSLAAHEYFHLWMVKRLKPVELEVLNYDQEVYTDLLWVMEGFTSYFEEKIMLDCGFYTEQKFINNLLSAMEKIQNSPGSREQSVAEASFDAWIKFYRRDENSVNNQISYYDKGMVLGALLDLEIIAGSKGKKSLDDVVSQLYHQYFKQKNTGVTSQIIKQASEKAAKKDLTSFFNDNVFSAKDLDNEKYLNLAGIDLIETNGDSGAKSIGISYGQSDNSLTIKTVIKGGSAFDNGFNVGDELISLNGYRVNSRNFTTILNHYKIGDMVTLLISRKGLVLEKELDIGKDETVNYRYEITKNPSKQQLKVYNTWLGK